MNSHSPDDTMPTFIQHLHAESDRFERTTDKPERDISHSFKEYIEEMQQFSAPDMETIAKEVQLFEEFLRGEEDISTAFVVPVFFAPQFGAKDADVRVHFFQFDKDGFTANGPYERSGYYMKVLPAEMAAGAIDMRAMLRDRGESDDIAELAAHQLKAAALELRTKVWEE